VLTFDRPQRAFKPSGSAGLTAFPGQSRSKSCGLTASTVRMPSLLAPSRGCDQGIAMIKGLPLLEPPRGRSSSTSTNTPFHALERSWPIWDCIADQFGQGEQSKARDDHRALQRARRAALLPIRSKQGADVLVELHCFSKGRHALTSDTCQGHS
jgi:hypothetical protein